MFSYLINLTECIRFCFSFLYSREMHYISFFYFVKLTYALRFDFFGCFVNQHFFFNFINNLKRDPLEENPAPKV